MKPELPNTEDLIWEEVIRRVGWLCEETYTDVSSELEGDEDE